MGIFVCRRNWRLCCSLRSVERITTSTQSILEQKSATRLLSVPTNEIRLWLLGFHVVFFRKSWLSCSIRRIRTQEIQLFLRQPWVWWRVLVFLSFQLGIAFLSFLPLNKKDMGHLAHTFWSTEKQLSRLMDEGLCQITGQGHKQDHGEMSQSNSCSISDALTWEDLGSEILDLRLRWFRIVRNHHFQFPIDLFPGGWAPTIVNLWMPWVWECN